VPADTLIDVMKKAEWERGEGSFGLKVGEIDVGTIA
jgi:hypothetical protein